ncbi:biotin/lipoate--protein ligase family protein [Sulfitobacter sp. D35]|uniref:biotin/lipoate--protein ligase family protein n=1 Tax=Sulfitobacter sp. D35 TaxID=3083252 RepID=UPI00296EED94|nr:biotin/lipoate--protein ligase family protein [Sulfitobacter sp. D35]MDW4497650.1 biotin/lipoate--protein ligase family protein [Sulfitobacter sp. D35]
MRLPVFPPLFEGRQAGDGGTPFVQAVDAAREGCDAGLVIYRIEADQMRAAIVFAPERSLSEAAAVLPACGTGFQNALGALAPPEVAVQIAWAGDILVNGGRCGELRLAGPHCATDAVPGWLVVGLELQLWPASEEGGLTPEITALFAEGCADVDPVDLLEAWVRHCLVWLDTWDSEGLGPLHREFAGLTHQSGETISVLGQSGTVTGLDENLGLLLKQDGQNLLLPLTRLMEVQP